MDRCSPCVDVLVPFKYECYPLGAILPRGWIEHEIKLSAQGLGGHLFHFYRFVKESKWLGGNSEYSALNESAPYWYNYIVPLAFSIDEKSNWKLAQAMQKQATFFLDYTLKQQSDDGWLGPEQTRETRGIWARCLLLQGMMNHALADSSRTEKIINSMIHFVHLVHSMLSDNYTGYIPRESDIFDPGLFGVARAHELSITLQWLHEVVDDCAEKAIIWEIMDMLWTASKQAGRDWTEFFTEDHFPMLPSVKGNASNFQHGVNVAQGLRYPAQKYRMHPSDSLRHQCRDALNMILRHHGTPSGSFSSDEYLGGQSPQRGVELCCTVEFIFSLNYLYCLFGDAAYAEQAEQAAFNALPAAISPDWWSHQYLTQINQPWATEMTLQKGEKVPFYDSGPYANVFGLEPEYPCCTVNHPAALPKFAMNSFLNVSNFGTGASKAAILQVYFIPAELVLSGIRIRCETAYPFSDHVNYKIECDHNFDFFIRVPSWATQNSTIRTSANNGASYSLPEPFQSNHSKEEPQSTYKLEIPASTTFHINLTLDAEIRVHHFPDKTISIHRGPLLFAYEIPHTQTSTPPHNYTDQPSASTDVSPPQQPPWTHHLLDHSLLPLHKTHWGIALPLNPTNPPRFIRAHPPSIPHLSAWTSVAAGMYIEVEAREIDWPVTNGTAADPGSFDAKGVVRGGVVEVRLVPFGCAKVHLARFPTL